jgi:hypothetical protein
MFLRVSYKKIYVKNVSFCILKVTEEISGIQIRTKMSRTPNTV